MAFRTTTTVNGTATYTGNWCMLGGGVPHNYSVTLRLGSGANAGTWKLEWTNSSEQEIKTGSPIVDDLPPPERVSQPAAMTINGNTDPVQSMRIQNLTAAGVRWSYTHALGTNITLTSEELIQRCI